MRSGPAFRPCATCESTQTVGKGAHHVLQQMDDRRCICDETDTFDDSVVATAAAYITAGLTPFGAEVIALDMAFQTVDMYMLQLLIV